MDASFDVTIPDPPPKLNRAFFLPPPLRFSHVLYNDRDPAVALQNYHVSMKTRPAHPVLRYLLGSASRISAAASNRLSRDLTSAHPANSPFASRYTKARCA